MIGARARRRTEAAFAVSMATVLAVAAVIVPTAARADEGSAPAGLHLSVSSPTGGPFAAGDEIAIAYTATNEAAVPIDTSGLAALTRLPGRVGTLSGDCGEVAGPTGDAAQVVEVALAMPVELAAGASVTCVRSFPATAEDVAAGGVWAQLHAAPVESGVLVLDAKGAAHGLAVTGKAVVGGPLSAAVGYLGPWGAAVAYQWLRDGAAIAGARSASYRPVAADAAHAVSVRITASAADGSTLQRLSAATAPVALGALAAATPTITGSAAVGAALTAVPGAWTTGTSFSYRWLRNGKTIAGATAATYKTVAADVGAQLGVAVTGALAGYGAATKTSAATAKVISAGTPTRTGALTVGSTQKAAPGTWTSGTSFAYQWLRNGVAIGGATAATYKLVAADAGKAITVRVTGKKSGYATVAKTSAKPALVAAAPTPRITGTVAIGSTLKANPGAWATGTTFTYQWLRSGAAIKGATKSTYKLVAADAAKQISVRVTGKKSGYATATTTSAKTAKAAKAATPKVSGTARVGTTLTAVKGTWTKGTRFTYQWLRDGVAIKGATKSTYKATAADVGKRISVRVTGRLSGYATVAKTSAAKAKTAAAVLTASTPKISGTAKVGSTLTAKAGTWTSGAKLKYQWYRSGTAIKGATGKTYRPRPTDAYAKITVKVTGSRAGYATKTKTSSAAAVKGKVYANCALLNAAYPDGIRKAGLTTDRKAGVPKPLVGKPYASTALYNLQSIARDADRDGIMCER